MHWRLRICRLSPSSKLSRSLPPAPTRFVHHPLPSRYRAATSLAPARRRALSLALPPSPSRSLCPAPTNLRGQLVLHPLPPPLPLFITPTLSLARALRPFSPSVVLSVPLFLSPSPSPPSPSPVTHSLVLSRCLTSERRDGERIGVSVVTPHARVMPSLLVQLRARRPSPAIASSSRRPSQSLARSLAANTARTPCHSLLPHLALPFAHAPHYHNALLRTGRFIRYRRKLLPSRMNGRADEIFSLPLSLRTEITATAAKSVSRKTRGSSEARM